MQCCICLEDMENPWDTDGLTLYACCGRTVHKKCGMDAAKHRSTCPWCRAPLPASTGEYMCLLRAGARANRGWAFFALAEHYRDKTSLGSDRLAKAMHERAIVHLKKDDWSRKLALGSKYIIAVVLWNQNRYRSFTEPERKRIMKLVTEAADGGHPRAKILLETMSGI